jgi:hypothetical protein
MGSALGSLRGMSQALVLIVATLVFAPGTARAQFPGYGWGYGFPGYGYGYAGPFGYGMPGYGYGMGYGFGMPGYGMGYGYGMPGYGYGYGMEGYGFPGTGIYYGYPAFAGFGYGGIATSPYLNPLFGLGLTPLGIHSYFTEMNLLGRGQLQASQRARARELQGYRGR